MLDQRPSRCQGRSLQLALSLPCVKSRALDSFVKQSRQIDAYRSSPMDTMGERLRRAMSIREVSVKDIVDAGVMSRANVYLILNGTTQPDKIRDDTVEELCRFLRINRKWLKTGKGPIEGDEGRTEPGWEDVTAFAQAVGLGAGAEAQEYAETHSLKFKASSLRKRGILGGKLAVYYGKGDSMEPTIKNGDAILFDESDTRVLDGRLYVVQSGKEIYVKRAEILDDAVYFRSDNPNGDHNWIKARRMDNKRSPITVIGRVHWIGAWAD